MEATLSFGCDSRGLIWSWKGPLRPACLLWPVSPQHRSHPHVQTKNLAMALGDPQRLLAFLWVNQGVRVLEDRRAAERAEEVSTPTCFSLAPSQ